MDANRKMWNEQQKELRLALTRRADHPGGVALFLAQHAALHAAELCPPGGWSFAEEALHGLDEAGARWMPPKGEHSVAWVVWHIARIEDMTMNVLVADRPQVFQQDGWGERLGVAVRDTGNAMDAAAIAAFSQQVDVAALLAYRLAVGRATQRVVGSLSAAQFKARVDPDRLARLRAECDVLEEAAWLLEYWGGLNIAQLLLMPPTRHNFVHLNEILHIRRQRR